MGGRVGHGSFVVSTPSTTPRAEVLLVTPSQYCVTTTPCGLCFSAPQYFVFFGLTCGASQSILLTRGCDVPPVAWGGRNLAVAGGNKGLRPGHARRLPSPEGQAQSRFGFGSGASGGPAPPSSELLGRQPTRKTAGRHGSRSVTQRARLFLSPCVFFPRIQKQENEHKRKQGRQKPIRDAT